MPIRSDAQRTQWFAQQDRSAWLREMVDFAMDGITVDFDILATIRNLKATIQADVDASTKSLASLAAAIDAQSPTLNTLLNLAYSDNNKSSSGSDQVAASVRFAVPIHRNQKTGKVTNVALMIDDGMDTGIDLIFDNLSGTPVAVPSGTATVTISNPAMTVAMDPAGAIVWVTPVQPPQDGAAGDITFTDVVNGVTLTATLVGVTVSASVVATSVHFDTTNVHTRPLTAPVAAPVAPAGPGAIGGP